MSWTRFSTAVYERGYVNHAYPRFRSTVGVLATLAYICAALVLIATVYRTFLASHVSYRLAAVTLGSGLMRALLIYFAARVVTDACMILADIGDASAEENKG